jgi:GT2 family glycosyltransferase
MIGLGIITCDRNEYYMDCLSGVDHNEVDYVVVVDDGAKRVSEYCHPKVKYIQTGPRSGVGNAKHTALEHLMELGCNHLFLMEDDIKIIKPGVFDRYIEASEKTGIQHMMFGYHGPANKAGISGGPPIAKYKFQMHEYDNGDPLVIALNQHCVGAFCYYSRKCIEECGNFDLAFRNAFEHVEHSMRIAQKGFTTGYWNWADIADSCDYLSEQACSEVSSSIRGFPEWGENIQKATEYFIKKHGVHPVGVPDITEHEVKQQLKQIFGRRNAAR